MSSDLTTRQHERKQVDLRVEFVIDESCQEQVRFSSMSSAPDPFTLPGRLVDVSRGGVGISTALFVPRTCVGDLKIFFPDVIGRGKEKLAFQHRVVVRRIRLVDHAPTYLLGMAFDQATPETETGIVAVMNEIETLAQHAGQDGGGVHA